MTTTKTAFDTMSAQEKCNVITNAVSELAYHFYYEQDRQGLDILNRDFTKLSALIRNCVDCLNFLNNQGEVFAKIYLLLEFLGQKGLTEEFVEHLEKLAEQARNYLDDKEISPLDEATAVRNIVKVMNQHEIEYILGEKA